MPLLAYVVVRGMNDPRRRRALRVPSLRGLNRWVYMPPQCSGHARRVKVVLSPDPASISKGLPNGPYEMDSWSWSNLHLDSPARARYYMGVI